MSRKQIGLRREVLPPSSSTVVVSSGGGVVVSSGSSRVGVSSGGGVLVSSGSSRVGVSSGGGVVVSSGSSRVAVSSGGDVVVSSGSSLVAVSSGGAVVVNSGSSTSGKGGRIDAFKTQNSTKTLSKNAGGGSAKITKTEKGRASVDKRSGDHGFKQQEASYKYSTKVNDKVKGCTTEHKTQVKFKTVITYNKNSAVVPKSSSGDNRIKY